MTSRWGQDSWANHGNVPFVAGCIQPERGWTDAESCGSEGPLLRQVKPRSVLAEVLHVEWEPCLTMTTQVCEYKKEWVPGLLWRGFLSPDQVLRSCFLFRMGLQGRGHTRGLPTGLVLSFVCLFSSDGIWRIKFFSLVVRVLDISSLSSHLSRKWRFSFVLRM